jgi:hypothetical protein
VPIAAVTSLAGLSDPTGCGTMRVVLSVIDFATSPASRRVNTLPRPRRVGDVP